MITHRKKIFKVSADRIDYYLASDIEAHNEDEAKEIYLKKLNEETIIINQSEITNFRADEIINFN